MNKEYYDDWLSDNKDELMKEYCDTEEFKDYCKECFNEWYEYQRD